MDVKVLYKSLYDYDPDLNIENIDDEMLIISLNEYLTLYAADANEMLVLNNSKIHWHMETEETAGFIIDILNGNLIVIETRSVLVKVIDIPSRYKV